MFYGSANTAFRIMVSLSMKGVNKTSSPTPRDALVAFAKLEIFGLIALEGPPETRVDAVDEVLEGTFTLLQILLSK